MQMENLLINDMKKLDAGFIAVCDAVSKTLSLEGRLALMENLNVNLPPNLTKDGYNVSQMIRFEDKFYNFGALQAISATARTLSLAGDNTTSTLVFARGFLQNIKRKNFNKSVERGIDLGVKEAVKLMKELSTPVDREILEKIAITSANGDEDLGKKVLEAYDQVGYESIVDVKSNSNSVEIQVIPQNGMKIDKGYSSPFFINNNQKAVWEASDVMVIGLETWQYDDNIKDFLKANRLKEDGSLQPILFFMEKENGDFRQTLLDLVEAHHLDCCLVIAPDGHSEIKNVTHIRDLALYTDGTPYRPVNNQPQKLIVGFADKVIVDHEKTLIIKSEISQVVLDRISEIKAIDSEKDADFNRERVQRLEGKSCIISVGGFTDNDINEKLDRLDDSLKAVKSAIPEGVIPGGGSALVYISNKMNKSFRNASEQRGYDLVKKVIQEPALQVLKNSKRENTENWFATFIGKKQYLKQSREKFGFGYNARTDEVEDLFKVGILDSVKAMRIALETAKETAVKMLLTEVVITLPKQK